MTLTPPSRRRVLSLTPTLTARIPPVETDAFTADHLTRLTDADRAALAERLVDEMEGGPFWIFAYGSLIWKPAFEYEEARRATVHGWHRSFCMRLQSWRGSPENPGLMLALDRGGACVGVAYRMPGDDARGRMLRLLEREVGSHEDLPWLRFLNLRAGNEKVRALTFYCAPRADPDLLRLPLAQQAQWMARAAGRAGSCAEYLLNTVSHLEELGIHDRYLWALQGAVAAEIEQAFPAMDANR